VRFEEVADCGPASDLFVHEHGWQSWSPTGTYPATATSPRPPNRDRRIAGFRPDKELPGAGFQGEGLLAVRHRDGGPVTIWEAPEPWSEVPSIRAGIRAGHLVVAADGPVRVSRIEATSMETALARWARRVARERALPKVASLPPVWCSWYRYMGTVTAGDVLDNAEAATELQVPVGIVQIDDGYEREVGDWLLTSPRFGHSLSEVAAAIRAGGRRAGIWIAPLLAAEHSALLREHREWMVRDAEAGMNWDQHLAILDVTRPDAAEWLSSIFRQLMGWGFDYFKLDFLYAGALPGRRHQDCPPLEAYRLALRLIRDAVGPAAILLACGAPILPSVGLVDAMRIGPDIALHLEPRDGADLSAPSQRGAALAARERAFLHGRFWANDPDCLIARPEMEGRREWADAVRRWGGLRGSGDGLRGLDGWGLEVTRRLLAPSPTQPLIAA
jgi:alpha-galactosidase